MLYIGIGRSLLNFNKSAPMAGYSTFGKSSIGIGCNLTATCFNINNNMYIVTVDLHGISGLLVQSVVEYCNIRGYKNITRRNLVVSATHTHTAMGGFYDSDMYNAFTSNSCGFIKPVFDFLVKRISKAVILSYKHQQLCTEITHTVGELSKIQINRSFNKSACNQINIITFNYNSVKFASMIYISVHPTVIGCNYDKLSSDFFGVARDILEDIAYKVGFFNMAVGDHAPYFKLFLDKTDSTYTEAYTQSESECIRAGTNLANQIKSILSNNDHKNLNIDNIGIHHRYCDIYNKTFTDVNNNILTTSKDPYIGCSALAGSKEAPQEIAKKFGIHALNGEHIDDWHDIDDKKPETFNILICPFMQKPAKVLRQCINTVYTMCTNYDISDIPRDFNIFNYWFDNVSIYTSPFEMTSGACDEIIAELKLKSSYNTYIITSITDTYISYLCNENDYNLQTYEGASTLYGPYSCKYLLYCYLNINENDFIVKKKYSKNRVNEGAHLVSTF